MTATSSDPKTRVQQWLQNNQSWVAAWLEGIDPPRRAIAASNVTILMATRVVKRKEGGGEDFGFMVAHSRVGVKKKDRERECAKDLAATFDLLPSEDFKAWCQVPDPSTAKKEVDPADLEKLTATVKAKLPKSRIDLPEPLAAVLVASIPWSAEQKWHGPDPELALLDRFEPGFAELMREARRVSGLVRKQWYLAVVWLRQDPQENTRPFPLGVGFATEKAVAKARALYAAEIRQEILTEEIFMKATAPYKEAPEGAEGQSATASS